MNLTKNLSPARVIAGALALAACVGSCAGSRGQDVVLRDVSRDVSRDGDAAIVNIQKSCADAYEISIREVRSRGAVDFSSPAKLTIDGHSRNMSIHIGITPAEIDNNASRILVVVKSPDLAREIQPGAEPPQVEIARSIALRAR